MQMDIYRIGTGSAATRLLRRLRAGSVETFPDVDENDPFDEDGDDEADDMIIDNDDDDDDDDDDENNLFEDDDPDTGVGGEATLSGITDFLLALPNSHPLVDSLMALEQLLDGAADEGESPTEVLLESTADGLVSYVGRLLDGDQSETERVAAFLTGIAATLYAAAGSQHNAHLAGELARVQLESLQAGRKPKRGRHV